MAILSYKNPRNNDVSVLTKVRIYQPSFIQINPYTAKINKALGVIQTLIDQSPPAKKKKSKIRKRPSRNEVHHHYNTTGKKRMSLTTRIDRIESVQQMLKERIANNKKDTRS